MKVAFYAPLKPPDHPVPSGDRTMARALLKALAHGGADARVVSELRSFASAPADEALAALRGDAAIERERLLADFRDRGWRPDVWLTYHPYYKSPDLVGPDISDALGISYATVEASYSSRRAKGEWSAWHEANLPALRQAAVHFVMTERDRQGMAGCSEVRGRLVDFPPFIELWDMSTRMDRITCTVFETPNEPPRRLTAVAMMRDDVKLKSYRFLAKAIGRIPIDSLHGWSLDVVGDGEARHDVEAAFAEALGAEKAKLVRWHGVIGRDDVYDILRQTDLFVWPGFDEGYGLAYLEAQAAGVPVVALRSGGVPAVVVDGETGILTAEGDADAFGQAILSLMRNDDLRAKMGLAAHAFVTRERSVERAAERLMDALRPLSG